MGVKQFYKYFYSIDTSLQAPSYIFVLWIPIPQKIANASNRTMSDSPNVVPCFWKTKTKKNDFLRLTDKLWTTKNMGGSPIMIDSWLDHTKQFRR